MNNKKCMRILLTAFAVVLLSAAVALAAQPKITYVRGFMMGNAVSVQMKWKSKAPVVSIEASAGKGGQMKVVQIKPGSGNKKTFRGFVGGTTLLLPLDMFSGTSDEVTYVLQAVDINGQRSRLVSRTLVKPVAKTSSDRMTKHVTGEWNKETMGSLDKMRDLDSRMDIPPVVGEIKIIKYSETTMAIGAAVGDNRGISELVFKIVNPATGMVVQEDVKMNLGKVFVGTSKTFTLPAGHYHAIVIAKDDAGNQSGETKEEFDMGKVAKPVTTHPATNGTTPVTPATPTDTLKPRVTSIDGPSVVMVGDKFTVKITAQDDTTLSEIIYRAGDAAMAVKYVKGTTATVSFDVAAIEPGEFVIDAMAKDKAGNMSDEARLVIKVGTAPE